VGALTRLRPETGGGSREKPCTVIFVTTPKRITAITGLDTTLAEAVLPVGTIVTITASERVTILRIEH
jgi:hypothetical protein